MSNGDEIANAITAGRVLYAGLFILFIMYPLILEIISGSEQNCERNELIVAIFAFLQSILVLRDSELQKKHLRQLTVENVKS